MVVERELLEVQEAAVAVVETMPAVPEIPLPSVPFRDTQEANQNHNLPPVMTGVEEAAVLEPLEQTVPMTQVRQVTVVLEHPQQLREQRLIMPVEAEEAPKLLAELLAVQEVQAVAGPEELMPQERRELLTLAVVAERQVQAQRQAEQVAPV